MNGEMKGVEEKEEVYRRRQQQRQQKQLEEQTCTGQNKHEGEQGKLEAQFAKFRINTGPAMNGLNWSSIPA